MSTAAVTGLATELRRRRDALRADLENRLATAKRDGREQLTADEREALETLRGLNERIEYQDQEAARGRLPSFGGKLGRNVNSGARIAPIGFGLEELRHAHERLAAGESVRLEARDFATAGPLLPAELAPWVTELQHEGRIADRLPAIGITVPSIEIIQINSVTGAAGIVAEGETKPEVTPVTTPLTVTAQKVAAHVGLSYEALADFDTFSNYVRIELQRQVIMAENAELLYGDGTTGHLHGFFRAANILSFDATTAAQDIDAIEQGIAALRVGPSLATPNLCVLNPTTWSTIRRTKDDFHRYLLSADPTADEASSIWGIEVVTTTQCQEGDGLLVDTGKYGRAVVREPLSMRIGWSGDDFTKNILRTVCEERLNNAIERPSAILHLKNLAAPAATTAKEVKESPAKK